MGVCTKERMMMMFRADRHDSRDTHGHALAKSCERNDLFYSEMYYEGRGQMMMRGDERQSHVMMMSIRERKVGYLVMIT